MAAGGNEIIQIPVEDVNINPIEDIVWYATHSIVNANVLRDMIFTLLETFGEPSGLPSEPVIHAIPDGST